MNADSRVEEKSASWFGLRDLQMKSPRAGELRRIVVRKRNHNDTTSTTGTKTNMDEQDGQDEDNGTPSRNPKRDLMMFGGQGSANGREFEG